MSHPKVEDIQVGIVIFCEAFAYGKRRTDGVIVVDGKTKSSIITRHVGEEERVKMARQTGEDPPKTQEVDVGAFDKTRGLADFLVEHRDDSRGDQGGWGGISIRARRCHPDGELNPEGEVITFNLCEGFEDYIPCTEIVITGKTKLVRDRS